ncbi:hypothetical protein QBC32DRAFT_398003 [Pseudoneurospora amorphoporcata]|uniref:Cytochrome c oxidase assembly protein COX20, mitochondrial n=1 Tax=Pseudoneurospora amorphoporcata TaxID=241081 RepID=A0AAN6NUW4_9PEZI|nr:hypothetical protein QBC32DRAFT_398003 [Pseudoneurospora amorphoporcata]
MSRDQTTTPTTPDAARSWLSGGFSSSSSSSPPTAPSQDLQPPQPTTSSSSSNQEPPLPGQPQPQPQQKQQQQHTNRIPISDAISSIKPQDFLSVHETPCARQGFMTGIGSGASIGVLRWIMGLPIPKAANWGVGCGILGAMAQYEYCQWQRRKEKEKMQRVVAVYTKKQAESRAKEAKERREKAERGEVTQEVPGKGKGEGEAQKKSWYKFW